jgi:hypothetical protein
MFLKITLHDQFFIKCGQLMSTEIQGVSQITYVIDRPAKPYVAEAYSNVK